MGTDNETNSREAQSRVLSTVVLVNVILWVVAMIALIFILQNGSSPKGLFVILASGLAAALAIVSVLPKPG